MKKFYILRTTVLTAVVNMKVGRNGKHSSSTEVIPQSEERAACDTWHLEMKYLILEFWVVTKEGSQRQKKIFSRKK